MKKNAYKVQYRMMDKNGTRKYTTTVEAWNRDDAKSQIEQRARKDEYIRVDKVERARLGQVGDGWIQL